MFPVPGDGSTQTIGEIDLGCPAKLLPSRCIIKRVPCVLTLALRPKAQARRVEQFSDPARHVTILDMRLPSKVPSSITAE